MLEQYRQPSWLLSDDVHLSKHLYIYIYIFMHCISLNCSQASEASETLTMLGYVVYYIGKALVKGNKFWYLIDGM